MTPPADFALTKLMPPRLRSARIARPALEQRLGDALARRRIVLLCAPAGYGKTAALVAALDARPRLDHAWISLDEGDDLQRLLGCLVAALEPFDPPWRSDPATLIAAAGESDEGARLAADGLLNALAGTAPEAGVLAFDDLHRVQDPAVAAFLERVVERLPPAWSVAVSSRVDPALPLARWRVAGELAEFRENDLRFDAEEVAALAAMQPGVAPLDLAALQARTGGWPAGVRLALRSRGGAGTAGDRHAFDFLAAEVLDQLPPALADFLLRSSVLPELGAARCDALLRRRDSARQLEEIERRGLFASVLDGDGGTQLRLHDLFRDFLEDRLLRERPAEGAALLARAADTEDDPQRRITLRLRAGDWPTAEAELRAPLRDWLTRGLLGQAQRALEAFPAAWRRQSAGWWALSALCAWARWDFAAVDAATEQALRLAMHSGDEGARLAALAYRALAHAQQDRHAEVQAALESLRDRPLPAEAAVVALTVAIWRAGDIGPPQALAALYEKRNALLAGQSDLSLWYQAVPSPRDTSLPGLRAPLQRYLAQVPPTALEAPTPLGATVRLMRGHLALWAGDLPAADAELEVAEEIARWLGQPRNVLFMLQLVRSQRAALVGDAAACAAAVADLQAEGAREPASPGRALVQRALAFLALRLRLTAGDAAGAAAQFALLDGPEPADSGLLGQRARRRCLPAYRAELGGAPSAAAWLDALAEPQALEWHGLAVEARLRGAAACLREGRGGDAVPLLEAALQRCRADGQVGSALLAGPQVLSALAAGFAGVPALAGPLQEWLALARRLRGGAPPTAAPASPGGLSLRELEVLQRIAAGDSNKLIARALSLSPHTVKRHVANILDKLGLASRAQAAAWHREHGAR